MRLEGRIVAITGGAMGIGRATALLFAEEGATVTLADVETDGADAVVKEIVGRGGGEMDARVDGVGAAHMSGRAG